MATDKKEQQMKEEISMYLRKKDYYDILGVSKTAEEAQIKKAYKKLALRFHPDKNSTTGSKQVFNKVSNAYTVLTDKDKRASYDRYGPEEDRAPQYRTRNQYSRQGYNQQDEFQEIFRQFFGGAGQGRYQNNHYQHFTFNMGGARANNQQQQQGNSNMFYFLLFIIIIYVLPAFLGKDKPYYSFKSSSVFRFKVKTSLLQTPYFVREQFFQTGQIDAQLLKSIEQKVDIEYLLKLKRDCDTSTWTRNKFNYQAKEYAGTAYEASYAKQAAAVDMSSCARFKYLQEKHPKYVKDLFYYY